MNESRTEKFLIGTVGLGAGVLALLLYRLFSFLSALILKNTSAFSNAAVIMIAGSITSGFIFFVGFRFLKDIFTDSLGIKRFSPTAILASVLCGASLNVLSISVVNLMKVPDEWIEANNESINLVKQAPFWVSFIAMYIVAPLVEELIFRGIMYSGVRRGWGIAAAIIVSSVIFGIAHGNILQGIYAALAGAVFAFAMEMTGSVWNAIAAHTAYNLSNYLAELLIPAVGYTGAIIIAALSFTGSIVLLITERLLRRQKKKEE